MCRINKFFLHDRNILRCYNFDKSSQSYQPANTTFQFQKEVMCVPVCNAGLISDCITKLKCNMHEELQSRAVLAYLTSSGAIDNIVDLNIILLSARKNVGFGITVVLLKNCCIAYLLKFVCASLVFQYYPTFERSSIIQIFVLAVRVLNKVVAVLNALKRRERDWQASSCLWRPWKFYAEKNSTLAWHVRLLFNTKKA